MTSLKLEGLINAVNNLDITDNMILEVKRKTSLLKFLKYLTSCQDNKINSKKTMCRNCKWISCKCNSINENPLNFTQASEVFHSLKEK